MFDLPPDDLKLSPEDYRQLRQSGIPRPGSKLRNKINRIAIDVAETYWREAGDIAALGYLLKTYRSCGKPEPRKLIGWDDELSLHAIDKYPFTYESQPCSDWETDLAELSINPPEYQANSEFLTFSATGEPSATKVKTHLECIERNIEIDPEDLSWDVVKESLGVADFFMCFNPYDLAAVGRMGAIAHRTSRCFIEWRATYCGVEVSDDLAIGYYYLAAKLGCPINWREYCDLIKAYRGDYSADFEFLDALSAGKVPLSNMDVFSRQIDHALQVVRDNAPARIEGEYPAFSRLRAGWQVIKAWWDWFFDCAGF